MFKQFAKVYNTITTNPVISASLRLQLRSNSTATNQKWDLLTAVCVERHPIITKTMTELEAKVKDLLQDIEEENSLKCNHELRLESEAKQKELLKKGIVTADTDKVLKITAQDLEDAGEAELKAFTTASRITEADSKNIKTSLERKLDKSLLLLVQQQIGEEKFWLPPQAMREEGETLRQTAERVLLQTCGKNFNAKIYGNAPIGFYKYVYPKQIRENGSRGAKVFYYLAKYMGGDVQEKVDYQWLDRAELGTALPAPIHRSVSMFLVPE